MAAKTKNSLLKTALNVWLRLLFASFMCFIVWMSIDAIGLSFFSEVTGYEIYAYGENGENPQLISSHVYAEGEDRSAEIKTKDNEVVLYNRAISAKADVVVDVLSSLLNLLIFGLFPYNILWNMGSHDENYVQLGRMNKDIYFGLKVGAVASIPSAALYLLLILGKIGVIPGGILKWHRLINTPFIPYIDAVEMGAKTAAELTVGSLLAVGATLLFVPLICWISYYLGYRQISIREKLVYKKNVSKDG